jgi:hypothetical protein
MANTATQEELKLELSPENIRKAFETLGIDPEAVLNKAANDKFDQTDEGKKSADKRDDDDDKEEGGEKKDKGSIEGKESEKDEEAEEAKEKGGKDDDDKEEVEKSVEADIEKGKKVDKSVSVKETPTGTDKKTQGGDEEDDLEGKNEDDKKLPKPKDKKLKNWDSKGVGAPITMEKAIENQELLIIRINESVDLLKSIEDSISDKVNLIALMNAKMSEQVEKSIAKMETFEGVYNDRINKSLSESDERLTKAVEERLDGEAKRIIENDELLKSIQQRLYKVETTSYGRKSVTATTYLKKGFEQEEGEDNTSVVRLSLSRDRQKISNILLQKSNVEVEGVPNNVMYENAVLSWDAGTPLTKAIMNDLTKTEGVHFTS